MIPMKRIALLTAMIFFILYGSDAMGGKLYKWVDEEGIAHFSDRIPFSPELSEDLIHEEEVKEADPIEPHEERGSVQPINPIEFLARCTFTIKGAQNIGTGFFISSNGYAVTCKHVVEEDQDHIAVLNDQKEFPIGVISVSDSHDLALIMVITSQKTPYPSFRDPITMDPGEQVFAIGSSAGLHATVTDGVFTALRKKMPTEDRVIQFSAPINPGNSGGPLIDGEGKVVGVVSWKIVSNKGVPVSGLGFAVPSEYLFEEYGAYMGE